MNGILGTRIQPQYAELRAGDVKDSQADISKALRLLGYRPTVCVRRRLEAHAGLVPDGECDRRRAPALSPE